MHKVRWQTLSWFCFAMLSFNLISNCECLELTVSLSNTGAEVNPPSNKYSALVIFGDSYSDNGHPRPAQYKSFLSPPPHLGGRYCDGLVWCELLAQNFSVESKVTFKDYAYNGAHIANKLVNLPYQLPPDTAAQIQTYLSDLRQYVQEALPTHLPDASILHAFWIGINPLVAIWRDFLREDQNAGGLSSLGPELNRKLDQNVEQLGNQLNQLLEDQNLSKFDSDYMLMTIPPLSDTQLILRGAAEAAKGNSSLTQKYIKWCRDIVDQFNRKLIDKVMSIKTNIRSSAQRSRIIVFDTVKFWTEVQSKPWLFGFNSLGPCFIDGHQCESPRDVIYWDVLHPSSHMHVELSNAILNFLEHLD